MQQRLHEVDHRLVWRLASRAFDLIARLLFLTAPKVDKNHQHARFDDVRIDREGLGKRYFGALVIFGAAKTYEDAVDVTRAESIMCEGKIRIELDSTLEMRDRSVAILG